MIQLTGQQVKEIWEEESEEFEKIYEGYMVSDGKYERCLIVFKDTTGVTYAVRISRSGSPFTDWYYDFEDTAPYSCNRVEEREVVIKKWVSIEKGGKKK